MISYRLKPPKWQIILEICVLILAIVAIYNSSINVIFRILLQFAVLLAGGINIYFYYHNFPDEILIYQNNILWKKNGIIHTPKSLPIIGDNYISLKRNSLQWWLITSENLNENIQEVRRHLIR